MPAPTRLDVLRQGLVAAALAAVAAGCSSDALLKTKQDSELMVLTPTYAVERNLGKGPVAVDLDDDLPGRAQMAGQPDPVTTGALDRERPEPAMPLTHRQDLGITAGIGGDGDGPPRQQDLIVGVSIRQGDVLVDDAAEARPHIRLGKSGWGGRAQNQDARPDIQQAHRRRVERPRAFHRPGISRARALRNVDLYRAPCQPGICQASLGLQSLTLTDVFRGRRR